MKVTGIICMIQGETLNYDLFLTGSIAPTNYFHCNKNEDDADDNGSYEEKLFDSELDKKKFRRLSRL